MLEDIRLKPEELNHNIAYIAIANTATDKAIKKICEYLITECDCYSPKEQRRFCAGCMIALKELVKK